MSRSRVVRVVVALITTSACAKDVIAPAAPPADDHPHLSISTTGFGIGGYLSRLNQRLAALGANHALARVDYLSTGSRGSVKYHVALAPDPGLMLPIRWVAGDSRREAEGRNITYLNYSPLMFATGASGLLDAESAIDGATHAWNLSQCWPVHLVKRPYKGGLPSAIIPGGDPFVADIVSLGFLSRAFFDLVLGAGAGSNVLRATFTFVFVGSDGPGSRWPTDTNHDGQLDAALQETWYNDGFGWSIDGRDGIPIATLALYEREGTSEEDRLRGTPLKLTQATEASPPAVTAAESLHGASSLQAADSHSTCSG